MVAIVVSIAAAISFLVCISPPRDEVEAFDVELEEVEIDDAEVDGIEEVDDEDDEDEDEDDLVNKK